MKFIIPLILLGTAFASYFLLIDPVYQNVQQIQARIAELDKALESSKQLLDVRDRLLEQYNSITEGNLEKIQKLLPNHVDNIRLVLEIANLAEAEGLALQNIALGASPTSEKLGPETELYRTIELVLNVGGTYRAFRTFSEKLEKSLRLVDVTGLSFSSSEKEKGKDDYLYTITIRTYWLKE